MESDHFATSLVYLISRNVKTNQVLTSMLVSSSKIEKQTKTKSQSLNTVPLKETHVAFVVVTLLIDV